MRQKAHTAAETRQKVPRADDLQWYVLSMQTAIET